MTLRVASTVYATNSGLGILAKDFYDHGIVTHPVIIRHGKHPTNLDWYPPGTPVIADVRRDGMQIMEDVLRQVDVFLAFETPFLWEIFGRCRDLGVKSAMLPMYECGLAHPPDRPDLYINPSLLDQQYYPDGVHISVPVDAAKVPWKLRTQARVFVHNSGHGGLKGRNGTHGLVQAMRLVRSPVRWIIRTQGKQINGHLLGGMADRVTLVEETVPYEQLWAEGDVFVFPTKWDALSLPVQEARASGMLVMTGDRFPMNAWLPREPLIPVAGYRRSRIGPPYNEIDEAIYRPEDIAATIDRVYDTDLTAYSESGRVWAQGMSWEALRPKYLTTLEGML